MSNRRSSKNVRRASTSVRGPSRPIDPRRAPGYAPRRGIDPFAIGLIVASSIAVLIFIIFIALQGSNNPSTAANNSTGTNATPNWTQTTVVFSTQTAPDVLPRISLEDAKALYDKGDVHMVDVRDKNLYDTGHIKGAANVPHGEIGTRIKELPRSGNLVLYCQWPHDEESASVAFTLKTAGYTNMKILQGPMSFDRWKNAGYPVAP